MVSYVAGVQYMSGKQNANKVESETEALVLIIYPETVSRPFVDMQ